MIMKKTMGFTLIELMIVIAIIMILAGALVARVSVAGDKAKIARATAEVGELAAACRAFYADTTCWPQNITQVTGTSASSGYNEIGDIESFVGDKYQGPYIDVETDNPYIRDPWNEVYKIYKSDENKLYASAGPKHEDIKVLVHVFSEPELGI